MKKIHWLTPLALAAASLAAAGALGKTNAEKTFAGARSYTVYVETRIEIPFVEDDQSSFFGAGFVIDDKRRWILTNAHVSGKSPAEIDITFSDGSSTSAKPVYIDSYLDLAILSFEEIEGAEYSQAELECRSVPPVGHPVGTFGHPEGLRFTGTRGIISGRTSQYGGEWLQTDAPISGGNSGGPLISLDTGRVVGINSASIEGDGVQNTNLAVLSTHACLIAQLLRDGRDPRPADLGMTFFYSESEPTLVVGQVFERGQAVGLRRGDHILAIDGETLERSTEGELLNRLRGRLDGAEIQFVRDEVDQTKATVLSARPNMLDRTGVYVSGALFSVSNHTDIQALNLDTSLMVHFVEDGSEAESADINYYDHLVAIDGQPIRSLEELIETIETHQPGQVASLDLVRFIQGEYRFVQDILAEIWLDDARVVRFE